MVTLVLSVKEKAGEGAGREGTSSMIWSVKGTDIETPEPQEPREPSPWFPCFSEIFKKNYKYQILRRILRTKEEFIIRYYVLLQFLYWQDMVNTGC